MANKVVPEAGIFLIAPPNLVDPNFRRTVLLLCEHTPDGSFGLVLNRPLGVHLGDILEDVDHEVFPLQQGGPVQTDTLHFLHSKGDHIPDALPVSDGIFWGGNFEAVKVLMSSGEIERTELRFFLGYAGWSPGQLQAEVENGGWILSPASKDLIFRMEPDELWRAALRRLGGDYAVLANFPEDPRLN